MVLINNWSGYLIIVLNCITWAHHDCLIIQDFWDTVSFKAKFLQILLGTEVGEIFHLCSPDSVTSWDKNFSELSLATVICWKRVPLSTWTCGAREAYEGKLKLKTSLEVTRLRKICSFDNAIKSSLFNTISDVVFARLVKAIVYSTNQSRHWYRSGRTFWLDKSYRVESLVQSECKFVIIAHL